MSTSNDIISRAHRDAERVGQIQALINLQQALRANLDQISHMLKPTDYSLRDMEFAKGNLTLGATARLLGTDVGSLVLFLIDLGIFSNKASMWSQPLKQYLDLGYFLIIPEEFRGGRHHRCPELLVTAKGRKWLHANATMGWMDCILRRDVLTTRAVTATDLPRPLSANESNRT